MKDPFKNLVLDEEEKELIRSLEAGEWKQIPNFEAEKKRYAEIAAYSIRLRKKKNINIRLTEADLLDLKKKASKAGMPYQTLAASVLHRYVTDSNDRL